MDSAQTVMARNLAGAAEQRWQEHKKDCPVCARTGRDRCEHGQEVFTRYQECTNELRRQRELDTQPAPGQMTMF